MEGPSLVIFKEDMAPFAGKKVIEAWGSIPESVQALKKLKKVLSWGKHGILVFDSDILRIHFLMFGSYLVNARKDREPKLSLVFPNGFVNFYTCSVKAISPAELSAYDWSIDLMSPDWNEKAVRKKAAEKPGRMVCDVLMDQTVFAGLGNIMKNEILYNRRLHPEARIGDLSSKELTLLVREARSYSFAFYHWKLAGVLRKNWAVFRKRICGGCGQSVTKRETGIGARMSYYCSHCQGNSPKLRSFAEA